jgi:PEP-CTERM motif-containing protein
MMKSTFGIAAVAALGMFAGQASAAVLVAEGFDYADGELTINDGTGDNVSGGLWTPHSGETFGDNIDVLGGSAILNNSGSEDANRAAAGGVDNGGTDTWYYAVKFTVTDDNLASDAVNEDYFAHLWGSGFAFRGRAYIANPSLNPGEFSIGLSATSGGLVTKTADIAYGVEHVIVVSFDPTTGTSNLWLNQASEAGAFITDTNAGAIGSVVSAIALRQDFISGPIADNEIAVNGVGLATTFDEAYAASMVPEPASLALIGLGGLAMLRRRTA